MPPKGAGKKKVKIEDEHPISDLQDLAHKLRITSVKMTQAAGSGFDLSLTQTSHYMCFLR